MSVPTRMRLRRMRLLVVLPVMAWFVVSSDHAEAVILSQQAKLTPLDGAALDQFGWSVAIDGDTAIVGASYDSDLEYWSGSAYIFQRTGSTWAQQAKLTALDGTPMDRFGWQVSISGNTAVVGSPYTRRPEHSGLSAGAAYVYHRTGDTWTQQAKLMASDYLSASTFGTSVSIDGDKVIVGSPLHTDPVDGQVGAAYLFQRSGSDNWTEQAILTPSDGFPGAQFGTSVAISGGASIIGIDPYADDPGAVYIYQGSAQQTKLTPPAGASVERWGLSVAISGVNAIAGDLGISDGGHLSGGAYVFRRSGNWTQEAKLAGSDAETLDLGGISVGISGDMAVVGASRDDHPDGRDDAGSAYLFQRTGSGWAQVLPKLTASDRGFEDEFGISVGISGDTVVVGAHQDNVRGPDSGSAYIFTTTSTLPGPLVGLKPSGGTDTTILNISTDPFSVAPALGGAGFPSLSGLDAQPGTLLLFASSGFGDGGRLFTIDPETGAATLIGPTGFDAVPGLAFDLDGTLFGSAFTTDNGDTLITIDPNSGVGTPVGPFGARYLDSLAVDPTSGILYGAGGDAPYELYSIDKTTATATSLGVLTEAGSGEELPNFIAGLAFDRSGSLYGSLGARDGQILSIDLSGPGGPTFTLLGDAASGSVSDIAFIIPEPTTLALLGIGGLSLLLHRRLRRNRAVMSR